MTFRSRLRRPGVGLKALFLLAAIGVFSVGYSILAENDLWPRLRPGALHNSDLVAGFAGAVALVALLVAEVGRRRAGGAAEDGGGRGGPRPEEGRFPAGSDPVPSSDAEGGAGLV